MFEELDKPHSAFSFAQTLISAQTFPSEWACRMISSRIHIRDRYPMRWGPGKVLVQHGANVRFEAETAMFRYKAVIGRGLHARTLSAQKIEAKVGCSVLNRMTRLGTPLSQRVA